MFRSATRTLGFQKKEDYMLSQFANRLAAADDYNLSDSTARNQSTRTLCHFT